MSKAHIAELRQASAGAIQELGVDPATGRSLAGAIDVMVAEELKPDILPVIADSASSVLIAGNLAYLVGSILTQSGIKLPGNKFDSPQNRQVVREIGARLVSPKRTLELSIGLGGSEDAPSLRMPSYISPALEIAQAFVRREVAPPVLRIYNAHEISSSLNGLDPERATLRARQTTELISAFVDSLYPTVGSSLQQEVLQIADMRQKGMDQHTAHLLELLNTPPDELSADAMLARQTLEKLRRASLKHGDHTNAEAEVIMCGYAAAHGISFHNYAAPGVHGVIKLGGQGEAPFDVIQQYMANKLAETSTAAVSNLNKDGSPQLINLRTKAGVLPPYYLERDEAGESHELTVETKPSDLPQSIDEILAHYRDHGLRSGDDFLHLPQQIAPTLPDFLRTHLMTTVRTGLGERVLSTL